MKTYEQQQSCKIALNCSPMKKWNYSSTKWGNFGGLFWKHLIHPHKTLHVGLSRKRDPSSDPSSVLGGFSSCASRVSGGAALCWTDFKAPCGRFVILGCVKHKLTWVWCFSCIAGYSRKNKLHRKTLSSHNVTWHTPTQTQHYCVNSERLKLKAENPPVTPCCWMTEKQQKTELPVLNVEASQ